MDSANAGGMGRNISRRKKAYKQEYNEREVDCEVYGCRVRTCNWLRHLGTKKHRDGMGLKTEVVGKIWVARAFLRRCGFLHKPSGWGGHAK